ncbi:MAG: nucleotidyltransferase family protein [Treponema sp.]|nr:nucleotidyltransferase family protein [Treponema sp.]
MKERETAQAGGVSAILMGAGFSRRYGGENKLLVPFRGKALARHALDLACGLNVPSRDMAPVFSSIFFIVADERAASLADGLPVTVIRNGAPYKGRRESARLGVEAAAGSDYYLFFHCDQPLLDADTVFKIMAARRPGKIVEPYCQGRAGSPSLFSSAFRDMLLTLGEGESPKTIKTRYPDSVIKIEIANPLALMDVDTPQDWEKLPPAI